MCNLRLSGVQSDGLELLEVNLCYTELFLSEIEDRLRLCMLPEDIFLLVSPGRSCPELDVLLKLVLALAILFACKLDVFRLTEGEASTLLSLAVVV